MMKFEPMTWSTWRIDLPRDLNDFLDHPQQKHAMNGIPRRAAELSGSTFFELFWPWSRPVTSEWRMRRYAVECSEYLLDTIIYPKAYLDVDWFGDKDGSR